MKPKVSVVVPVYNAENYLSECLESVLHQSLSEIEVIVVDDGSTDSSKTTIKKYSELDPRIVPIFQNNSGPSNARNNALKASKGDYITFLDADDWIDKEMYEVLYSAIYKYDAEVAFSDLVFEFPDSKTKTLEMQVPSNEVLLKKDIKEYILPTFIKDGRFGNPIKLYKKDLLERYNINFPEDRSLGEDFYFNMEVFTHCESAFYVNEPYYHYRQSVDGNSLMKKYRPELFDLYINKSPIESYFRKWGLYTDGIAYKLAMRKCFIAANGCIQNEFKTDCKNTFKQKVNNISKVINHPDVHKSAKMLLEIEGKIEKRIYLKMLKNKNVVGLYVMGKGLSLIKLVKYSYFNTIMRTHS